MARRDVLPDSSDYWNIDPARSNEARQTLDNIARKRAPIMAKLQQARRQHPLYLIAIGYIVSFYAPTGCHECTACPVSNLPRSNSATTHMAARRRAADALRAFNKENQAAERSAQRLLRRTAVFSL